METLLLSKSDIEKVLTMKDVISIVDKTFKGFGQGTVVNPTKITLDLGEIAEWPPYKGFMNAMPAYVGWLDSAGIKWVGGFLENSKKRLPFLTGMILLINPKNGQFKVVMEGSEITNLRTGAQTAVALKYLWDKKSINIGLYGAGMQAYYQIMAISQIYNINKLKVYDIRRLASEKFAEKTMDFISGSTIVVDSAEEAACSDAVICVTQSKDKFVKNYWLKPGTIFFPLGSYQECEDELILNIDRIIVDHIGQSLHRGALKELSEKGKITKNSIHATLGEVAIGKIKGRDTDQESVLCQLVGTGALDVAVASITYNRALEKGLGSKFSFI